jgi:hypothetical protein
MKVVFAILFLAGSDRIDDMVFSFAALPCHQYADDLTWRLALVYQILSPLFNFRNKEQS